MTKVFAQVSTEVLAEVLAGQVSGLRFGPVSSVGDLVCLVEVDDDGVPETWAGRLVEYVLGRDDTQPGMIRVIGRSLAVRDDGGQ